MSAPHDRPRGPLAQHFNQAGKPKRAFASRETAERDGFRPYECEMCGKWHRATAPGRKAKGAAMKPAPVKVRAATLKSGAPNASAAKKRKPIAAMSARAKARIPERQACREAVLERDRGCVAAAVWPELPCAGRLEVHEPLPRSRGGDPYDPDQAVAVCSQHHRALTDNPKLAVARGLTVSGYRAVKGVLGGDRE